MTEIEYTEARNGIKLPIINTDFDSELSRDGTHLVRDFFGNLWELNDISGITDGSNLNELVVPASSQSPLLVFRSLYSARQLRDIEHDDIVQSTRPDYDRMQISTGSLLQSVLTTPEQGSQDWSYLLSFSHNTSRSATGSTSYWDVLRDSVGAPALELAKDEWQTLSNDLWKREHQKAVKQLLNQIVSIAQ
jgi:hypothetical protein